MRKLIWLGVFFLAGVVCATSVSQAQNVSYQYTGPLDGLQTLLQKDIVAVEPAHRVARLEPIKKLRPVHLGVSSAVIGRITRPATFVPAKQVSEMVGRVVSPSRPSLSTQVFAEALPFDPASPTFDSPLTESRSLPVEADYNRGYSEPPRPGYSGPLTAPKEDPTRFGYRDGKSFGFDNTRLYHPLEGPQLNLQGAPTAFLGPPGCDEWAGFCGIRALDLITDCGGLKLRPGHLGLPWLGNKDNCDQTVPLFKKRNRGCQKCGAEKTCESCSECATCGR